jgi:hypothetical protein
VNEVFTQPDVTRHCISVIEKYRTDQSVPVEVLTQHIQDQSGIPINFYQWRAIRNGMSKNVPVHVIVIAATFLGIPAHEIFPSLDS